MGLGSMKYVEVVSVGDLGLMSIMKVDKLTFAIERQNVKDFVMEGGWGAVNVAVGLTRLETPAGLIGCIGRDLIGQGFLSLMKEEGVDVSRIKIVDKGTTGNRIVVVDLKGRSLELIYKGTNEKWDESIVDEEYISNSRALYLVGNVFTDGRRSLAFKLLREAKKLGKTVFFNIGSTFLSTGSSALSNLRSLIDYWLMTEDQAIELLGTLSQSALRFFLKKMEGKAIFIKLNTEGTYVFAKNISQKLPLQKVSIKDTIGLDEAYDTGFIYGILNGYDLEGAAKIANLVASYKLEKGGAWSLPRYEEISQKL
ncbi:MAG: hypothetical protein DRJ47_04590 [Thermoprotei archaeon]|nr:MAG: hypothetical protein DRJ47_04590 [Thermoprotei archaeon]